MMLDANWLIRTSVLDEMSTMLLNNGPISDVLASANLLADAVMCVKVHMQKVA